MKSSGRFIGSGIVFAQALLFAACQSTGTGGGTGGGGGAATAGTTGAGMTGGTTAAAGGGAGGAGGAGGKTGTGGVAGNTGTGGGAGGSATGGMSASGGASGGAVTGGRSGTGGTISSGGQSGTAGTSGATGGTTGPGTGGAQGGAAGGASGQGGQGSGGSGAGGTTAVTCTAPAPTGGSYTVDTTGVTFTVGNGKMRVQVCQADIIRVEYTSASAIPSKTSLSVSATWGTPSFCVTEASGTVTITTARMKAKVNTSTGLVSYTDASDVALVAESSKATTTATVEGTSTYKIDTSFTSSSDEALFGLGQQQGNVMNRKNSSTKLINSNMNIYIPMIVSNKGYGIFWDNPSTGNFNSTATTTSYSSECGEMVDYYFFYGPTIDQVVAGYRATTGTAPLFPKWAYGLFQSKDHYGSQTEVLNVVNGYRNAKIPVDVVVQDWNYWDPYSWGSHIMDPSRYANPSTMLTTMHTANIHGMISIWPEYQYMANPPTGVAGDQDNYKALDAIGALLTNNGSAYRFYDTMNADARTLVYQQIYDKLLGKYGWDAIWADNTEPQDYPSGAIPNMRGVTTALGKGAFHINAYPLQHTKALYDGWRKVGPNTKRVYVLTRSAWAGTQRYSASVWSGDIQADVATYAKQIPAGLNYALSGMPYWTTDIGGYFGTPTEELFTRWFQFGAFCSVFRIHGQATKELYGNQWSATGKANLLAADTLHYRLMPYLYSLAWKTTNESYTIMRHLIFDYQKDSNVFNIKDQFMYGPALLINPVTTAGATSRSVYLPTGTWYDFWTGSAKTGGSSTTVDAPLSQIPIFVKAGSIVPMGPKIQYATESVDPLEIRIYKGQNGSFVLYEDEGDTYNYETGKYSQIPFSWDDSAGTLTIGARTGSFTGMPTSRTFNVVWVGANHGAGIDVVATADKTVKYDGTQVAVSAQ
jgi:alpha-D-xyloside xylohydrolase